MTTKTNFQDAPIGSISKLQIEAQRLRAEAMADVAHALFTGIARLFAPLVRLGKRTVSSLERRHAVDRIYRELSQMTDRDLADIGLNRSDIMAVAEGTYRRHTAPVVELRPAAKAAEHEAELARAA